jgi:glucosamine--fructose-6-phosphate aminotransferase (isomerizing)
MSKMLDEIREQPKSLETTLATGIKSSEGPRKRLGGWKPRLVIIAARGSSDNAGQFGRYLIEIAAGIPISLAAPSVFTLYGATIDLHDVLVVGISQSGESTDTNRFLERAKELGAVTVGITNGAGSTMAKLVDCALLVRAGRERSVAATKTYTGQLLMLYLLVHALGGRVRLDALRRIPDWVSAALRLESVIAERSTAYRYMERALVVGRGFNYGDALEFALKLMETCQVVADRFSSADLLYGPIAMVAPSFPVFVFAPAGVTTPSLQAVLDRLSALRAETLVFTDRHSRGTVRGMAAEITVPIARSAAPGEPDDLYTPIPYIVPAQIFAASLAGHKRLDPDSPRGLRKITRTL